MYKKVKETSLVYFFSTINIAIKLNFIGYICYGLQVIYKLQNFTFVFFKSMILVSNILNNKI